MTDTIQKIADEMRENRGNHLPAHVREWADRLTALSARASAGEGEPIGYIDPQRIHELKEGRLNIALFAERMGGNSLPLYAAAPQPATGEEDSPQDISWWVRRLGEIEEGLRSLLAAAPQPQEAPMPVRIDCPQCTAPHVDEGEWATRPHKTHQCQACGHEWRPFPYATVGTPPAQATVKESLTVHPAHGDGEGDAWTYPNRNALIREVCEGLRGYRFDVDPVCVMAIINSIPAQVFSRMAPPALTTRPTPEAQEEMDAARLASVVVIDSEMVERGCLAAVPAYRAMRPEQQRIVSNQVIRTLTAALEKKP